VGTFTAGRTQLDCPRAMGTHAFSQQRAESFRHILLLPSPSVVHHRRKPTNLRVSLRARAAQFQASGLGVRRHAGACSPPAQRTTTGYVGRCAEIVEARSIAAFASNCPTQAKSGLEWATRRSQSREAESPPFCPLENVNSGKLGGRRHVTGL
jgi:hypothetical protein